MERTIFNCITGETITIYDGDKGSTPRVAMFIKCNRLLTREALEEKHRGYMSR